MGDARETNRTIPTLDGWRALAVLAVVSSHAIAHDSPLRYLRVFGPHGVSVFFGISGFLIATKLLEEEAKRGRPDLKAFYVRRIFRILPPAFGFLGVVALLGVMGVLQPMPLRQLASCTFFFQNYLGEFAGRVPYTGHFWSLAVEEHFYFVLPCLLVMLGSRRLLRVVPALCLAAIAWRALDDRLGLVHAIFPGAHADYRTDRCFDLLLWGVFLALVLRRPQVRAVLSRWLTTPVWAALAVAYLADMWLWPAHVAQTLEGVLVALLLAGTVLRPKLAAGRVLEHPVLQSIGRVSYSVYLWQQLFCVAAFRVPEWPQRFPLNLAFTFACAYASHRFLEEPMIALGRRVLARTRAPVPAPVATVREKRAA